MKSQAKSFNDFRFIVGAGTVTISRRLPNWNKNVTSGPSISQNTRKNLKKHKRIYLNYAEYL